MHQTTRAACHAILIGILIAAVGCSPLSVKVLQTDDPDAPSVSFETDTRNEPPKFPQSTFLVTLTDERGAVVWREETTVESMPLRMTVPTGRYVLTAENSKVYVDIKPGRTVAATLNLKDHVAANDAAEKVEGVAMCVVYTVAFPLIVGMMMIMVAQGHRC